MVNYKLVYTKQAGKDAKKLSNSGLKSKALELLEIISLNPYQNRDCKLNCVNHL